MKTDVDDLLMSPELEGQIPEVEHAVEQMEDTLAVAILELSLETGNPDDDLIVGSLVGISFGPIVEIDLRLKTKEAFTICSQWHKLGVMGCAAFHYNCGEQENRVEGPWYVSKVRMTDLDPEKGTCTLGVDLKYLNAPT